MFITITLFRNTILILSGLLLILACGSGEQITERDEDTDQFPVSLERTIAESEQPEETPEEFEEMEREEYRIFILNRSRLQDSFSVFSHSQPEEHFHSFDERLSDPYQGFRIQILSTRDVSLADSTRADFEDWAQERFAEYVPNSYIHYRQPYYRVRIGDFQDRDRAIELSRLIQLRYPDAWIIHDRIEPNRVAADTVQIRFRAPGDPGRIPVLPNSDEEQEN